MHWRAWQIRPATLSSTSSTQKKCKTPPSFTYGVYVNLPEGETSEAAISQRFAGTLNLFGIADSDKGEHSKLRSVDVTKVILAIEEDFAVQSVQGDDLASSAGFGECRPADRTPFRNRRNRDSAEKSAIRVRADRRACCRDDVQRSVRRATFGRTVDERRRAGSPMGRTAFALSGPAE